MPKHTSPPRRALSLFRHPALAFMTVVVIVMGVVGVLALRASDDSTTSAIPTTVMPPIATPEVMDWVVEARAVSMLPPDVGDDEVVARATQLADRAAAQMMGDPRWRFAERAAQAVAADPQNPGPRRQLDAAAARLGR